MTADTPPRKPAAVANPEAREFLRNADPVLAELIDARPDFRPRAWMDGLPPLDAFATLIFQVVGQQLSVAATRTIVSRIEERFAAGPSRTWFRSPPRTASSTRKAASPTKASSCSSGR
jgi:3-methyladenine DNA glycosylase/8-oxoguanine DNA glycosylase